MKLIIAILFLFLNTDVGYVVVKTGHEIPYGKLSWRDFKVKPIVENTAAESATSIGYKYDGNQKVAVYCTLNTDESFVTKEGMTPYILNHEQRHFDITYIFANKFIERLSGQKALTSKLVDDIYAQILTEKEVMQDQYDFETNNSQNKQVQSAWDKKIEKLLP